MAEDIRQVFKTSLKWKEGKRGTLVLKGKPELDVASPPAFGGPEGVWSPQELFVASAEACNMTTFLSMMKRKGIELESYESETEGVLETTDDGLVITTIVIKPKVTVKNPEQAETAKQVLGRVHKVCIVSNSMKTEVRVEME